ncbi:MAG: hypothetical protein PF486_06590 [Prolixibacteraceae bacterium]|jgi:hypothetical protein|nr:hypothetical protein [Prolixibacteraceae bacterium]
MNNFNFKEDQLYSLRGTIRENDEEAGAREWYEENKAFIDGMFE